MRSGSGTCSSTSIAAARSNSPSANGRLSAGSVAELEVRTRRVAHSAWSFGSARSIPTHAACPRAAPPTGGSARPRRSRRRAPTPARPAVNSSSSVRSKPAISRRTTGFVEPYLSNVLPVGTATGAVAGGGDVRRPAHTSSALRSGRAGHGPSPASRGHAGSWAAPVDDDRLLAGPVASWPAGRWCLAGSGVSGRPGLVVRRLDPELELDPPHALERPLRQRALGVEQVADHAERAEQHRGVEQHGAARSATGRGRGRSWALDEEHQKRMNTASAARPIIDRARSRTPSAARTASRCGRSRARCAARTRPSTGTAATRASSGWSGSARGRPRPAACPAWMIVSSVYVNFDDGLHLQRRLAVVGAEAGGRVGDRRSTDAWRTTHEPSRWSTFLSGEKCSIVSTWRSPTTMSASPREDRRDELGDVAAFVLVVGVGVDDHVGAELQAGVEAGLERGGEALVVGQPDDVVDAVRARDLDRPVGRAVVDDQPLDRVEARAPRAGGGPASPAAGPPR